MEQIWEVLWGDRNGMNNLKGVGRVEGEYPDAGKGWFSNGKEDILSRSDFFGKVSMMK